MPFNVTKTKSSLRTGASTTRQGTIKKKPKKPKNVATRAKSAAKAKLSKGGAKKKVGVTTTTGRKARTVKTLKKPVKKAPTKARKKATKRGKY
jgi:hypothetical protein